MYAYFAAVVLALASNPHALVDSAIAAMQRGSSLAAVRGVRLVGIDHSWMLGNAERAEGPWRVSYSQFTELYDPRDGGLRRTSRALLPAGGVDAERVTIVTDSVIGIFAG